MGEDQDRPPQKEIEFTFKVILERLYHSIVFLNPLIRIRGKRNVNSCRLVWFLYLNFTFWFFFTLLIFLIEFLKSFLVSPVFLGNFLESKFSTHDVCPPPPFLKPLVLGVEMCRINTAEDGWWLNKISLFVLQHIFCMRPCKHSSMLAQHWNDLPPRNGRGEGSVVWQWPSYIDGIGSGSTLC